MKVLFVGGQEDGRWHEIHDGVESWTVIEREKLPPAGKTDFSAKMPIEPSAGGLLRYNAVKLSGMERVYCIMVWEGLSGCCPLEILLSGYRVGI